MGKSDKEYDTGIENSSTEDDNSELQLQSRSLAAAEKSGGSCICCLIKLVLLPTALLGIASGLVIYFIGGNEALPETFQGILPDIDLFRQEDPTGGEIYLWRQANGAGLDLTLINALDTSWDPFFNLAVVEWDNGSPDSLTLSTQDRQPDPDCNVITGVLKICNGDYGNTDWKGVNFLHLQGEMIMSSVGKMNDFFLPDGDFAIRQYTMCHEIGHGFGLPHTDERFWNRDQGNCMDYTRRFKNNMQPDTVNFETLSGVYGIVGGTGPASVLPAQTPSANTGQEDDEEKEKDDKDDRKLRRQPAAMGNLKQSHHEPFPERVLKAIKAVHEMVHIGDVRPGENGWRMLHENSYGRSLEIDLIDGYKVQVHFLLA